RTSKRRKSRKPASASLQFKGATNTKLKSWPAISSTTTLRGSGSAARRSAVEAAKPPSRNSAAASASTVAARGGGGERGEGGRHPGNQADGASDGEPVLEALPSRARVRPGGCDQDGIP